MKNIMTLFWLIFFLVYGYHKIKCFKKSKLYKWVIITDLFVFGLFWTNLTYAHFLSNPQSVIENAPDLVTMGFKLKKRVFGKIKKVDKTVGKIPCIKQTRNFYSKSGLKNANRITTRIALKSGISIPMKDKSENPLIGFGKKTIKFVKVLVPFI